MNKYKAITQAERVHAILQSVSRGDTASKDENCLLISEETIRELVSTSEYVKQSLLTLIEGDDKAYIDVPDLRNGTISFSK